MIDELPYLVAACPSLPSVLQRWIDHDASKARLVVALAGSSQRMMQGLVLDRSSPLFRRAQEVFEVPPLAPEFLLEGFPDAGPVELVETFTAWGGVPRYWELALSVPANSAAEQIDHLVLDPLGPLHQEPDRLLLEETPPAIELRPILDVIGAGVHRVSEIAGRIGRPATSMARSLERLHSLSLIEREVPFGESERKSRRALYRIADPFLRLWFRVVAPHRSELAIVPRRSRGAILQRYWDALLALGWEQLCRQQLPKLGASSLLGDEAWGAAARWWQANEPELAEGLNRSRLLLGEAKWSARPFDRKLLKKAALELAQRRAPVLAGRYSRHEVVRVLLVPAITPQDDDGRRTIEGVCVLTAADLL
ncbi:MAG: ATP-binding protein [Planctomycetota bacterium]